jgi:hypothetical protein
MILFEMLCVITSDVDTDIVTIFIYIHTIIIGSNVDNIISIMHSTDVPTILFTILFKFLKKEVCLLEFLPT